MPPFPLLRPVDPDAARTAAMLAQDVYTLRRVFARSGRWTATAVENAHHGIYGTTGPWLGLARSRRDATDSPADRARWSAWISALTPPENLVIKGTSADVAALVGKARDMLRTLRQTLPPCPSVSSVAAEIERLIRTGELAPPVRISVAPLARGLRVPREHVDLALADLAAMGLVEVRASGRAAVTVPDAGRPTGAHGRQQAGGASQSEARAA